MKVTKVDEIEDALFEYHLELVSFILSRIQNTSLGNIVEIGSGSGTFTMPLLKGLGNNFEKFYCVDSFTGPYSKARKILESKVKSNKKVEIIDTDAGEIDKTLSDVDLVIGHEVLCDLNSEQVDQVISACFNVLKGKGMFVHSELSPFAMSRAEELVQIANKYSEEPISDTKWFSPSADELAGTAYSVGFRSVRVEYQKIPLIFMNEAAFEMLKRWKTKREFLDNFGDEIYNTGIEYPMEQILFCLK